MRGALFFSDLAYSFPVLGMQSVEKGSGLASHMKFSRFLRRGPGFVWNQWGEGFLRERRGTRRALDTRGWAIG